MNSCSELCIKLVDKISLVVKTVPFIFTLIHNRVNATQSMETGFFFESYYNNAEVNSILIMDSDGIVLDVNKSFTNNFGYTNQEIRGKNFSILFNESDRLKNTPVLELKTVISKGQAHDENYIVNKRGHSIWCTGESILIKGKDGEKYIVKDVVNLQAKKQLQLFLTETEELLERIFETSNDVPMIELDGSLKIQKVNKALLDLYEIEDSPVTGSRLSDLNHS